MNMCWNIYRRNSWNIYRPMMGM